MNIEKYNKIVKDKCPSENHLKNIIISFVSGGVIGLLGEFFVKFLLSKSINESDAYLYLMLLLVTIGSTLTMFGVFDKIASFFKCGVIVPTTGFAHAMSASAIDHHSEGLIKGIGANIFKMTGTIILYGTVSGILFALIKVII